jgi:replication-associated recombination protein RarA
MRWYEKYRPSKMADILGQPVTRALETFAIEPYPSILILEGASGTGKTCAAMILADMLADKGWFGKSVHELNGAELDVDTARRYFDSNTSPFRFCVSNNKHHVLAIEELEWMSPQCQRYLKDTIEKAQRRWRVIVIATSNNSSKLEYALRSRFKSFCFSSGPTFADAINAWLPTVWELEMGPDVEMPYSWESFGWNGKEFSARQALDILETYALQNRAEVLLTTRT